MADFAKTPKAAERRTEAQNDSPTAKTKAIWEKAAPRSFFSLSDVKVHYNSDKPARLGALAYTQDAQVYIAPGQRQTLQHELGHVVQQKCRQIPVRRRLGGVPINDDPVLESQADRLGASAFPLMENTESVGGGAAQCLLTNAKAIRAYATEKGFPVLPDAIVEGLVKFINDTVGNGGLFKYPALDSLDPFFVRLTQKQAALNNERAFQNYLTDIGTVLGEIWNTKLDTSPMNKRDGAVVAPSYGPYYSSTYSDVIDLLDADQQRDFCNQILILKNYCQQAGIDSVVEGAAINVKRAVTLLQYAKAGAELNQRALAVFMNRLRLMTDYIRRTGDEKEGEQVIKDRYWIKSTGSDPHAGGQHALFLIERRNPKNKRLYKPHSLRFENAILGDSGVIDSLNQIIGKRLLPTMGFKPDAHTEDYVERDGSYDNPLTNTKAVKEKFWKLGALESVMRMTGITDLHAENIMFTKYGPIAIDAECGAFYGLTGITAGSAPGNTPETVLVNPSALYLQEFASGKKDQVMREAFQRDFDDGKRHMESMIFNYKDKILENFRERLRGVDSCRIVPFSTAELANYLERTIFDENSVKIAITTLEPLNKFLHSTAMAYYQEGMIVDLDRTVYVNCFSAALEAGTLPAFSIQFQDSPAAPEGAILLDGTIIGKVKLPVPLLDAYIAKAREVINKFLPA